MGRVLWPISLAKMPGAILQPQPPPCERDVSRGAAWEVVWSVVMVRQGARQPVYAVAAKLKIMHPFGCQPTIVRLLGVQGRVRVLVGGRPLGWRCPVALRSTSWCARAVCQAPFANRRLHLAGAGLLSLCLANSPQGLHMMRRQVTWTQEDLQR